MENIHRKNNQVVVRVNKSENPFIQIDKYPLNDCNLSWKAKGLLAYLLSHPPDWQIIIEDLIAKAKDGRDSLYAGLKELEDNGYLKREQLKNEQGKFMSVEYIIFERPQAVSGNSGNGKTVSGKSDTTNNNNTKNKVTKNKVGVVTSPAQLNEEIWQKAKEVSEKFPREVIYRLLSQFPADYVREKVEMMLTTKVTKNAPGWLIRACQENYQLLPAEKKEKKKPRRVPKNNTCTHDKYRDLYRLPPADFNPLTNQ